MGLNPNQILFIITTSSLLALAIGYVAMPSDEDKIKRFEKHMKHNQSFRPEVIKKMSEDEKTGQQFMDAIRKTANSDQIFFGKKKSDKNE